MYDEDLVEDSLAFAKRLKEFLNEKQADTAGSSDEVQPASSALPPQKPVTGENITEQHRPAPSQLRPTQQPVPAQAQSRPAQPPVQPTAQQAVQPQAQPRPAQQAVQAQAQPRPVHQPVQPQAQPRPTQQAVPAQAQPRPAQQAVQPQAQPRPTQQAAQAQAQPRPAQQPVQPQAQPRPTQQAAPAQAQPRPAQQAVPAQAQPRPAQQPVQPQTQSRPAQQPIPAQAQPRPAQQAAQAQAQPRPAQQAVQPQTQSRPAQQPIPAQAQPRSAQQAVQPQVQPRPVQQPVQSQAQPRPVQQSVQQPVQSQAQPRPVQQSVQQPVQPQAQPRPAQQAVPVQAQPSPVSQEVSVADEAIIRLREMQKAQEESGETKQQISVEKAIAEKTVVQPQTTGDVVNPVEAESIQKVKDSGNNHTFEITIKFDFDGIKRKMGQLKEKLMPETRTLEDVNAAMEENRQLMEEKQGQTSEGDDSLAGRVKGVAGRIPKLIKRGDALEQTAEEGDAIDAEITLLEDEPSESKLAARLDNAKDIISQKASSAARIVTNVIIFAFCIGIAYFFADFVTNYVAHQTTVEGESMEPTLSDGDIVIIQRLSYYFREPSRYDVVVFPVGDTSYDEISNKNTYYIKRVIGLPGETVQIIDGSVYIDGNQLKDDKYALSDILEAGVAANPLVLGEDQYFVMGDNRNMSSDSRNSYVGLVNKNDIVGEAWICMWPFGHFGSLKG